MTIKIRELSGGDVGCVAGTDGQNERAGEEEEEQVVHPFAT